MISRHVSDRINERVNDAGERATIEARCAAVAALHTGDTRSTAIRVWRTAVKRNSVDGSNGDTAILIVRGGVGVTLMWRRVTQPFTPDALRVDRVEDRSV